MDNRPLKKVLERDGYTIVDRSISLGGEQRMKVLVPEERFEPSRSSHSVTPESVEDQYFRGASVALEDRYRALAAMTEFEFELRSVNANANGVMGYRLVTRITLRIILGARVC